MPDTAPLSEDISSPALAIWEVERTRYAVAQAALASGELKGESKQASEAIVSAYLARYGKLEKFLQADKDHSGAIDEKELLESASLQMELREIHGETLSQQEVLEAAMRHVKDIQEGQKQWQEMAGTAYPEVPRPS